MIEFRDVTKKYKKTVAINELSLKVKEQGIYCLLGRNGAGKTTLLKLLAGQTNATSGELFVNNVKVSAKDVPGDVSFVENSAVQFNLKIGELIEMADHLNENFDYKFATDMLNRFSLDRYKKYKHLSYGMRTMFVTILMLSSNSKIVLLDEPALGFDAIARKEFYDLVMESSLNHPRIIIISTHLVDEIAQIAQQLILLDKGSLVLQKDIAELDEEAYSLTGNAEVVMPLTKELNVIGKTSVGSMVAVHIFDRRIDPPRDVSISRMGLQDFFINIVGGKNNE